MSLTRDTFTATLVCARLEFQTAYMPMIEGDCATYSCSEVVVARGTHVKGMEGRE